LNIILDNIGTERIDYYMLKAQLAYQLYQEADAKKNFLMYIGVLADVRKGAKL